MLSKVWVFIVCTALLFGIINNRLVEVAAASVEGAKAAVTLMLGIIGPICLWSGIMELLKRSGFADKMEKLLSPALELLFKGLKDNETKQAISANVTANILGLGNAATPLGIKAVQSLSKLNGNVKTASDHICTLVILNTASIQIIPATIISVRSSLGSKNPFEILPVVWISSVIALFCGITCAKILRKLV